MASGRWLLRRSITDAATSSSALGAARAPTGVRAFSPRSAQPYVINTARRRNPSGASIGTAAQPDLTGLHPEIVSATFTLAVDVDNPLYGPLGAANVYAPQKGANPDQVIELDRSLRRWADVVERETKTDHRTAAGAGAAGGVGFAALAVLGARMQPGIDVILDRIELDRHLQSARAVVTGEGSLDRQSLRGKAAVGGRVGVPAPAAYRRSPSRGCRRWPQPKFVPQDSPASMRSAT